MAGANLVRKDISMSIGTLVAPVLALAISVAAPHAVAAQVACNNPNGPIIGQPCRMLGQTRLSQDCKSILSCLMNQQNQTVWAQYMSTNAPSGNVTGGCVVSYGGGTSNSPYGNYISGNWGTGCLPADTSAPSTSNNLYSFAVADSANGYSCGPISIYNIDPNPTLNFITYECIKN